MTQGDAAVRHFEALAATLRGVGVDVVFGLMGDANLFMVDDWIARYGGRYIGVAHENAAVLAAGGYASTTDRVGVASITHGPAVTNVATALVDLVRARLPVLVLAGSTDPADRGHLQYVDQAALVAATGAAYERSVLPERVTADVLRCLAQAHAERRPVVLEVPAHVQWSDVPVPPATAAPAPIGPAHPDPAAIEEAAGVLASARRPVVVGGRGARHARAALESLARRIGAPVATSVRGKELFRDHPHDLGIMGTLSDPVASEVLAAADVIISFGASLNQYTTAGGGWLEGKRVVQVDDDVRALGRWSTPDVAVLGDAAATAELLEALLDEAEVPASGFASPALAERLAARHVDGEQAADGASLGTLEALRLVDSLVPRDRVLVIDDGRFMLSAFTEVRVEAPGDYVHGACFASIGLSMGYALGAAAACEDRTVLVVTGDGGFVNGGLAEFVTAARYGLRIVVVVMNDGAYGAEYMQFVAREMDPKRSQFEWPEFGPVGTAMGGCGRTVRTAEELIAALGAATATSGPALVDVVLDPSEVPGVR